MDATTHSHATPETHHDEHGHEHHELGFWRKYVFSTDHKVIGIQYGITGLLFLFFGFVLMMLMRWSIAHGAQPLPWFIGSLAHRLFSEDVFATAKDPAGNVIGYFLTNNGYNVFGAMHGTIMVFFG